MDENDDGSNKDRENRGSEQAEGAAQREQAPDFDEKENMHPVSGFLCFSGLPCLLAKSAWHDTYSRLLLFSY